MSHLLITREERVLRFTLNDPERHNLLTKILCIELVGALTEAGKDDAVGCVLLDANGPAFCVGLPLDEFLHPGETEELSAIHERLFTLGAHYPKPIVAAVQGAAVGAGVGLMANSHVVLAAQGTQFGLTEIRSGFWPFVVHRAMVQAIGERRTVELSLTGRAFSAADAHQYGLVHEVTPPFELDDRATATARQLAYSSQETLRQGLEFARRSRDLSWEAPCRLSAEYTERATQSADFREGVNAHREKRKPAWPSLGDS